MGHNEGPVKRFNVKELDMNMSAGTIKWRFAGSASLTFSRVVVSTDTATEKAIFTNATSPTFCFGDTSSDASAVLQANSTTQGFLPPRVTTAQRDAISSPAAGLVVFNTSTGKLNVYTTAWEAVTSA